MSRKTVTSFNLHQLSIGDKLLLAITASSFFIVALAFVIVIPIDLDRMKQINEDEARVFIKAFNKDFTRVVLLNTIEESVNLTDHLRNFPLVQRVALTNSDGDRLFTYLRSREEGNYRYQTDDFNIMDVQHINESISYMGEEYGRVSLIVSNSRLDNRIKHYFLIISPLIFGLLIVAYIIARLLRNYFATPIVKLSNAVNEIAKSRDYSRRLHSKSQDEIGVLYKGFNALLSTVVDAHTSLEKEKEQAIFTLNSITDAVIRTNHLGNVEYINPIAESMVGLTEKTVISKPIEGLFSIVTTGKRKPVTNPITQCIRENRIVNEKNDHIMIMRDYREVDIECSAAPIHDQDKNIVGTVMVFKDVTQTREATQRLSYQASHDALTKLLNRRAFKKRLKRAYESAKTKQQRHILFYMDLDKFKTINDNSGHLAGDEVLSNISDLLSANLRETDILARLGGDEFGALLSDCELERGKTVAEKLRKAIEDYRLIWGDQIYQISISIGIVAITSESEDIESIINAADTACYAAKEDGRNCVRVYLKENNVTSNITHFPKPGK